MLFVNCWWSGDCSSDAGWGALDRRGTITIIIIIRIITSCIIIITTAIDYCSILYDIVVFLVRGNGAEEGRSSGIAAAWILRNYVSTRVYQLFTPGPAVHSWTSCTPFLIVI